jgi:hypothetical protein
LSLFFSLILKIDSKHTNNWNWFLGNEAIFIRKTFFPQKKHVFRNPKFVCLTHVIKQLKHHNQKAVGENQILHVLRGSFSKKR